MDYLTNHYKNLCEQLQEKLNILEAQISEAMSEDEALGMPVPMLRTGKRGNYEQWRAANDARNAALRDARMGGGGEKIIGKLVRAEDLDKKPGKADTKFPSDFFKPGYVLPGREPRPGDAGMIRPDSKPTPKDPSKPLPFINPQREPRPGDRGPIPFNPDRKPLFPGMNPNPFIKPGLKPVNPSKIPSDMFRPGKRTPKIPTGGLLPAPERIDYDLERKLPKYYTGSLPKLGDSNLIGKIPTEQEAYGGKLMSTMQQSQVDLEGKPTGLVKNIPVKPKIDPRYKR